MDSGATRQKGKAPESRASNAPAYLLVMTATIVPAENAGVRRADPRLRLEDYKQALRYWLRYPHPVADRILLLENSGADLSELRSIAADENPQGRQVEILSVPGNRIPEGTNYGYTEMELLDRGLALSELRQRTTHMVKVTGRLVFPALGEALDRIGARLDTPLELMIECRKLGFPRRGFDANAQLFACSHGFYDRVLRDSKREMNMTDIRLLEHLLYRKAIPFRGQPGVFLRFPLNIDPVGYSGFKSRSYRSAKFVAAAWVRAVLRRIAPDYWF